jgi:FkbM family methyltransferase
MSLKNLVINKSVSILSETQYLILMRFLSIGLFILGYDSPSKIDFTFVDFGQLGTRKIYKVTFRSGRLFWLVNPIRINRLLKGIDRSGNRLWGRYSLSRVTSIDDIEVFVDIGANIGELSLLLSKTATRVIAVEPDPIARYCLIHNLATRTNCIVLDVALGNQSGLLPLYIKSDSADTTLLASGDDYIESIVECRTGNDILSELLADDVRSTIKIDAEGYEPEVLQGMSKILTKISSIAIDAGMERYGKSTSHDCALLLERAALKVQIVDNSIVLGSR